MVEFANPESELTVKCKRQVTTSWPISIFWIFLSFILAVLSTYSFLQADWVIKRNLVVTNYYELRNHSLINLDSIYLKSFPESKEEAERESLRFIEETEMLNFDSILDGGIIAEKFVKEKNEIREAEEELEEGENLMSGQILEKEGRIIKVTEVLTSVRFGTIGVCSTANTLIKCQLYKDTDQLTVSHIWVMVTIIGGSGCITLCVSAVISILAVALPSSLLRHQVATTIGHAQTLAVFLLFVSLLLFPFGFGSEFVRFHCGPSSRSYNLGECEVGWAYALVLVCASLALYCPVLVKFTADIRYDTLPKYI